MVSDRARGGIGINMITLDTRIDLFEGFRTGVDRIMENERS